MRTFLQNFLNGSCFLWWTVDSLQAYACVHVWIWSLHLCVPLFLCLCFVCLVNSKSLVLLSFWKRTHRISTTIHAHSKDLTKRHVFLPSHTPSTSTYMHKPTSLPHVLVYTHTHTCTHTDTDTHTHTHTHTYTHTHTSVAERYVKLRVFFYYYSYVWICYLFLLQFDVQVALLDYRLQPFSMFLRQILDQLQEKDTDSIFAEPVSLEEVSVWLVTVCLLFGFAKIHWHCCSWSLKLQGSNSGQWITKNK